jgi:hypothetical protein
MNAWHHLSVRSRHLALDLVPDLQAELVYGSDGRELHLSSQRPTSGPGFEQLCAQWSVLVSDSLERLQPIDWLHFRFLEQTILRVRPDWLLTGTQSGMSAYYGREVLRPSYDQLCRVMEFQQSCGESILATSVCDHPRYGDRVHAVLATPPVPQAEARLSVSRWLQPAGQVGRSSYDYSPRRLPEHFGDRRPPLHYFRDLMRYLERDGVVRDFYYEFWQPDLQALTWTVAQATLVRQWGPQGDRPVVVTTVRSSDWGLVPPAA